MRIGQGDSPCAAGRTEGRGERTEACAESLSMPSWLAWRTGPSTPAHAL